MNLRTVEVYASYQGEGPQTGQPTTFVRFAGCNLKCPLWPCDTQHAIDPKIFKDTQRHWSPAGLADHVATFGDANICLTGGEVFLQRQDDLQEFIAHLRGAERFVECFTNGTLPIRPAIADMVHSFILDWKLPGSGEKFTEVIQRIRQTNLETLGEDDAIKFTIADGHDYDEAVKVWERLIKDVDDTPGVYAGVVWGKLETQELVAWMQSDDLPWNLNVQTHKHIWHPDKIGV